MKKNLEWNGDYFLFPLLLEKKKERKETHVLSFGNHLYNFFRISREHWVDYRHQNVGQLINTFFSLLENLAENKLERIFTCDTSILILKSIFEMTKVSNVKRHLFSLDWRLEIKFRRKSYNLVMWVNILFLWSIIAIFSVE